MEPLWLCWPQVQGKGAESRSLGAQAGIVWKEVTQAVPGLVSPAGGETGSELPTGQRLPAVPVCCLLQLSPPLPVPPGVCTRAPVCAGRRHCKLEPACAG